MVKSVCILFLLLMLFACQNYEKIDNQLFQELRVAIENCRKCNSQSDKLPFSAELTLDYFECQKKLFVEIRRVEALPNLDNYPKAKQAAFGYSLQVTVNVTHINIGLNAAFQDDFIVRNGRFAQEFVDDIPENNNNILHTTFRENALKLIEAILSYAPDSSVLFAQYPVPTDLQPKYGAVLSRQTILAEYETRGYYRLTLSKWKPVIDSLKVQFPEEKIIPVFEKLYAAPQIDTNFSLAYLKILFEET